VATATNTLISQYYPPDRHPYRILEGQGMLYVSPNCVLLDAGCGHSAPLLRNLAPYVGRAIGVDVCDAHPPGVEYIQADLANTQLPSESIDLVVSRSVLEHISVPLDVFRELHRVLKPGGRFVFLTPNRWDYASLAALAIPNRLHPWLVRRLTDRKECDTFPTFYRANSSRALRRLARQSGFEVESIRYLNQYPDYFRKILPLFLLGVAYERLTSATESLGFLRGWILGTLVRGARESSE
jgi:SAM-dependent methyltransferase